MTTAVNLVHHGYFPKELPPPFTTEALALLLNSKGAAFTGDFAQNSKKTSKPCIHNLARVGSLRRKLSIPNPVNFVQLAVRLAVDWQQLQAFCNRSNLSLSTPVLTNTAGRAIGRKEAMNAIPIHRAKLRATSNFILSADIASFYPTIYTHSIPWALNGKVAAKAAKQSPALLGNELDRLIRNGQEGQTMGIPIGPDTSLVIAETVLVGMELAAHIQSPGFRYIDDFEFGFRTISEAESALATLQSVTAEFSLQLNPSKTRIIALPEPIDESWVSELRIFPFRSDRKSQRYDLIHYFNRAFELAKLHPAQAVLKYAISRTDGIAIDPNNWSLFQHLILQSATSEPGALSFVIEQLKFYSEQHYQLDGAALASALSSIVTTQAPLGHGSEVAWALWGAILFQLHLTSSAVNALQHIDDPVVALLALDANAQGLLGAGFAAALWQSHMTPDELFDDQWLLAYEANVKRWLPSVGVADHVSSVPAFSFLKAEGVVFYNDTRRNTYLSDRRRNAIVWGGGGASTSG